MAQRKGVQNKRVDSFTGYAGIDKVKKQLDSSITPLRFRFSDRNIYRVMLATPIMLLMGWANCYAAEEKIVNSLDLWQMVNIISRLERVDKHSVEKNLQLPLTKSGENDWTLEYQSPAADLSDGVSVSRISLRVASGLGEGPGLIEVEIDRTSRCVKFSELISKYPAAVGTLPAHPLPDGGKQFMVETVSARMMFYFVSNGIDCLSGILYDPSKLVAR